MCRLESKLLPACGCQAFEDKPSYCRAYLAAHSTPQEWIRTMTSRDIAKQYGPRDYTTDGVRYITLSDPDKDPFPPLDCSHKEVLQSPLGICDCPFHEMEKAEDFRNSIFGKCERKRKELEGKVKKVGGWFWRNLSGAPDPNFRYPKGHALAGMADTRLWYSDYGKNVAKE